MQVVGRHKLSGFMRKYPQSRSPLAAWLKEVEAVRWRRWADIKKLYPTADLLGRQSEGHRVIFNIKGNSYRLAVLVSFRTGAVLVERVGTHAQYDKWKLEGAP